MRVILDTEKWVVNGHTAPGVNLEVLPISSTLKIGAKQYETTPTHLGNSSFFLAPQRLTVEFDFMVNNPADFNRAQELAYKSSWMRQQGVIDDFTVKIFDYYVVDREGRQRAFCGSNPTSTISGDVTLIQYQPQLLCKLTVSLKSRNLCGGVFSVRIMENFKLPDTTCPIISPASLCPLTYSYNGTEEGQYSGNSFFTGLSFDTPTYRGYQIGVNSGDVGGLSKLSNGVAFFVTVERRTEDVAYVLINSLSRFQFLSSSAPLFRLDLYAAQVSYDLGGAAPPALNEARWSLVAMQGGRIYYNPNSNVRFPTSGGFVNNTGTLNLEASFFNPTLLWGEGYMLPAGAPGLDTSVGAPPIEVGVAVLVDSECPSFQCEIKTLSGSWQPMGGDRVCYGIDFPRPVSFSGEFIPFSGGEWNVRVTYNSNYYNEFGEQETSTYTDRYIFFDYSPPDTPNTFVYAQTMLMPTSPTQFDVTAVVTFMGTAPNETGVGGPDEYRPVMYRAIFQDGVLYVDSANAVDAIGGSFTTVLTTTFAPVWRELTPSGLGALFVPSGTFEVGWASLAYVTSETQLRVDATLSTIFTP